MDPQTVNITTESAAPLLLKWVALVVTLEKAYVEKLGPADFALTWFRGIGPDLNQRFYQSAAFDKAYTASTTELNVAKRTELLQKAVAVLYDDAPNLFLIEGFDIWGASSKIDGLKARGDQEPTFEGISLK